MTDRLVELTSSQQEVLIVAPTGQDAKLIAKTLERDGISSLCLFDIPTLCKRLKEEAGAILLAEEALTEHGIRLLTATLQTQEPWSDIPLTVMTTRGEATAAAQRILQTFSTSGSVNLIERPFRPITLSSMMKVALRARRRQYQMRELLSLQIKATQTRDDFISIASHELKTPLTALKLQTQLHKRHQSRNPESFPEPIVQLVQSTDKQVDRLTRLVEDMLDVSRINSGKLVIQKTSFNLSDLVNEVIEQFMPQFNAAKCTVEKSLATDVIGNWDRYRIEQVVNNLITNAIRYSPGKRVRVSVVKKDETYAQISVQDEGTGIAIQDQERIFQRFERAVISSNISGLGLGLYICRQIMDSHQGSIQVQSNPGQGSIFTVELPIQAHPTIATGS